MAGSSSGGCRGCSGDRHGRHLTLNAGTIALYVGLRATSVLLRILPASAVQRLAALVGGLAFYLFPIPRRAIIGNLEVAIPGLTKSQLRRIARRTFQNDARNWVDTLRINNLSAESLIQSIPVDGREYIESAVAAGRGLILVTAHLGNFDLVGQVLAARGFRLTMPVERMRPKRLFEFLVAQRASKGMNIVPVEKGPRELIRAIRRGEIAGLAGDRYVSGQGVYVNFFGVPARLPRGPASLARHTGAPLIVGVGIRESGGFRGVATPPLPMQNTGDPEVDDVANTQTIVTAMESYIRRYPEQWLAFSPLWDGEHVTEAPATIGATK